MRFFLLPREHIDIHTLPILSIQALKTSQLKSPIETLIFLLLSSFVKIGLIYPFYPLLIYYWIKSILPFPPLGYLFPC